MSDIKITTPFEANKENSATYQDVIQYYEQLSEMSDRIECQPMGQTDSGQPLHVIIIDKHSRFDAAEAREEGKAICLINNGIHPGEPCGIDASMMFARDILSNDDILDEVVFVIIPVYNIGGALNRGSHSRANQVGPNAYGFRGNAQNLDLNRDFVKCDSKNAMWFNLIFNMWSPDVMIDTHTSNGADYQYVMTLIGTQRDKLGVVLGDYMYEQMMPVLYDGMEKAGWEMIPYVNVRRVPEDGIAAFLDLPRYSSGYAALHHTISFMPETHMLKTFEERVNSTLAFLNISARYMANDKENLLAARHAAVQAYADNDQSDLQWELDQSREEKLAFKGYKHGFKPSAISGKDRLFYDRSQPVDLQIPYFERYNALLTVEKPQAYIIPQAYESVVHRLIWNGVDLQQVSADTSVEVEVYYIEDMETTSFPYEGHYLHSKVQVRSEMQTVQLYEGDYVVQLDQPAQRYIMETLEPQGPDSYFAWNFFDGVLMQKEYFSSYVFEDLAEKFLDENPDVRTALEQAKANDESLRENPRAQLDFVYKRSPHYERTHRRYPIFRLLPED